MSQQPPVFTESEAYSHAADASADAPADAVSQAAQGLARVFYRQDQEKAVLDARGQMTERFAEIRDSLAGETDFGKASQKFEDGAAKIYAEMEGHATDDRTQNVIRSSYAEMHQATQADVGRQITAQRNSAFLAAVEGRIAQLNQDAATDPDATLTGSKAEIQGLGEALFKTGVLDTEGAARYTRNALGELDNARASWMVQQSPGHGRDALMESGENGSGFTQFTDLDPQRRTALSWEANGRAEANTANLASLQVQRDDEIWSGKGDGAGWVQTAQALGLAGDRAVAWDASRRATLDAKTAYDALRFSRPEDWGTRLAAFDEKARLPGNEDYQGAAKRLHREVEQLRQRWSEDPAQMAAQQSQLPPPPPGMKEWPLGAQMAQRLAVIDTLHVAGIAGAGRAPTRERLLTNAEMQGNLTALREAPGEQKPQLLKTMLDGMGSYAHRGIAQMHREGGLPVEYVHMADRNTPGPAVDVLSRTVDASRADLVQRLADPAQDRERIEQAVRGQFDEGVGRTFADAQDAGERLEMTVKTALHHGQRLSPEAAARRAMQDLWGHVQQVGTVRLPPSVTVEGKAKITEGLEHELAHIERHEPAVDDAQHLERLRSEGQWFTYAGRDGDMEGVELRWEGAPVMDSTERPVRVRLDDIQAGNFPDKRTQQERQVSGVMWHYDRSMGRDPDSRGAASAGDSLTGDEDEGARR
jgi:hypothetical protein